MTKPFDVTSITDFPREPSNESSTKLISPPAKSQTEVECGSFMILCKDDISWIRVAFIEDGGYQILRISIEGRDSQDLVLNHEQIRILLHQMTLWITR